MYGIPACCMLTPNPGAVAASTCAIDVPAMSDFDHFDDDRGVVDRVDNTINALSDTVQVSACQLLAAVWARIVT